MLKILIFIIILVFSTIISAQNISFGVSTKLIGGQTTEPFIKNGSFIDIGTDWYILQYGLGFNLDIFRLNNFKIEYTNMLNYGRSEDAVQNRTIDPNNHEIIIKTDINYFFTFNNALVLFYDLTQFLEVGSGVNTIFRSYEYSDKFKSGSYELDLGEKEFNTFNFGPTIIMGSELIKNLNFQIGANYYINTDQYKVARVKYDADIGGGEYASKNISNWEYHLSISYKL